jgi:hypothetical protein
MALPFKTIPYETMGNTNVLCKSNEKNLGTVELMGSGVLLPKLVLCFVFCGVLEKRKKERRKSGTHLDLPFLETNTSRKDEVSDVGVSLSCSFTNIKVQAKQQMHLKFPSCYHF